MSSPVRPLRCLLIARNLHIVPLSSTVKVYLIAASNQAYTIQPGYDLQDLRGGGAGATPKGHPAAHQMIFRLVQAKKKPCWRANALQTPMSTPPA